MLLFSISRTCGQNLTSLRIFLNSTNHFSTQKQDLASIIPIVMTVTGTGATNVDSMYVGANVREQCTNCFETTVNYRKL